MLVQYSCGCIGFVPFNTNGDAWIVEPCDSDAYGNQFNLFIRNVRRKTSKSLSLDESHALMEKIARLVNEGYDLRHVKSILK